MVPMVIADASFLGLALQMHRPTARGDIGLYESPEDGKGVDVSDLVGDLRGRKTLLVLMGSCDGCSAHPYRTERIRSGLARDAEAVVLVYDRALPKSMPPTDRRQIMRLDRDGSWHARLNAMDTPRAFWVDRDAKILDSDPSEQRRYLP